MSQANSVQGARVRPTNPAELRKFLDEEFASRREAKRLIQSGERQKPTTAELDRLQREAHTNQRRSYAVDQDKESKDE